MGLVGSRQVESGLAWSVRVWLGRIGSDQVGSGWIWWGRVGSGQIAGQKFSPSSYFSATLLASLYIRVVWTCPRRSVSEVTYHVTYHVRPHQPIIDEQGLGLRGLVHKEAHPVIPDLH